MGGRASLPDLKCYSAGKKRKNTHQNTQMQSTVDHDSEKKTICSRQKSPET